MKAKIALLLGLLSLAACGQADGTAEAPRPREVTDASVAQFCGMALAEHGGPKAQIFVRGLADPYWFASVRDAFAFTMLQETPKAIAAIYVNDMARAQNWDQPEVGTGSKRIRPSTSSTAVAAAAWAPTRRFRSAPPTRRKPSPKRTAAGSSRFADMPRAYVLASASGDRP